MKSRSARALLLGLVGQMSCVYAANTNGNASKQIDTLVSHYAECCSFTGTVLVSEHNRVVFKKGYGLANREWNIPNTPDVKFRIGSITKQFTSMLVMQQVAKGSIKLDGHLSDYLPYYRQDTGSKVTISPIAQPYFGHPQLYGRSQILW
jgi:CubicO group peptidase (beta-lactamase class C family)